MDRFQADAARLADRAGHFDGYAERAGAIHRELADRLAAAGDCWGTDDVGHSFAAAHTAPADRTLTALGGLPARLGDVGGRFHDTAHAYRDTDTANATALDSADA
ncbi:hypothetical protein [Actinokineospora enzanensis]|uniref:hypothetical protein n=1 Tax=Actinokineospora enzanensis TaxID=155975 RepID=UPI00037A16BB|nr:hypothetical protein [Actinokineospora enzanensis]